MEKQPVILIAGDAFNKHSTLYKISDKSRKKKHSHQEITND